MTILIVLSAQIYLSEALQIALDPLGCVDAHPGSIPTPTVPTYTYRDPSALIFHWSKYFEERALWVMKIFNTCFYVRIDLDISALPELVACGSPRTTSRNSTDLAPLCGLHRQRIEE